MYQRLHLNRTKAKYRQIVEETLVQTKASLERFPLIGMYKSIYNQIVDIKENIIDKNIRFSEDDMQQRYTLGAIAVKNFDLEHEEYGQRLSDIFGGADEYFDSPEGYTL
jgi:hypothetical protein